MKEMINSPARRIGFVLPCAKRKRPDPEPLPAWQRYNSSLWHSWRSSTSPANGWKGPPPPLMILSGRYGFIDPTTPIPDYDEALTKSKLSVIWHGGEEVRRNWGMMRFSEFAGGLDAIVLCGSGLYTGHMREVLTFVRRAPESADRRQIILCTGPVGQMRQKLNEALRWA